MSTNTTINFAPQISSAEPALRLVEKIRRVLGNSICRFLEEPGIIEIMLNADGTLWIERLTAGMECIGTMQASQAESVICSVAAFHKQIVTRDNPIFEGELPLNGERFEALIPPVVSSPVFTIRLKASKVFTLGEYVNVGIMTAQQKEVIEGAVISRQNILVVGGTGTGKTTLTNAIIDAIERLTPEHRLIIIEDTAEIQCAAKNANLLHATDTVDMLRLLKATMRLRPDRILVGEVRGPEALALLKAWNTGHPGGASTVHANGARAGLIRLEQLIAETSTSPMQKLIAEAVDLIVSITKTPNGRKVDEILSVKGFQNGDYIFESKGEKAVKDKRQRAIAAKGALSAFAISLVLADQAQAAAAGAGLPWEAPLQTITRSIQGPVAYGISLLSLIGCGGTLVWGGEINEFLRKGILLVLVISLIVFATNMMTTLFNTNGAVI